MHIGWLVKMEIISFIYHMKSETEVICPKIMLNKIVY